MNIKEIVKLVTPPFLIKLGKRLLPVRKDKGVAEWEFIPEGWAYAETHPEVKGWNVSGVLETSKSKWQQFTKMSTGTGPLGIAHEAKQITRADIASHNTVMAFAYALALSAHKQDSISLLDWGGGIGHYFVLARSLLPGIQIEYHCRDLPVLTKYGAQLFPDQHFYADDSCFARGYDLVLASSTLHYVRDWQTTLAHLAAATNRYLFVTRFPVSFNAPSFVFIQRPYSFGYDTEYLGWCLNRTTFLEQAEQMGLKIMREFVIGEPFAISNAPESSQNMGFLFRR